MCLNAFAGQIHMIQRCLIATGWVLAWFELKATSQVELFHLLFSEAHRPCLEALRGKIRGFLISIWDTCLSQLSIPIVQDEVN